jgi:hypothetical protein
MKWYKLGYIPILLYQMGTVQPTVPRIPEYSNIKIVTQLNKMIKSCLKVTTLTSLHKF